ncbi:MAG: SDH family Clp fold serine proteinase [Gemmatimonadales bacterium]
MPAHLRAFGKNQPRIDLVLYTTGGDIMAAYRLVPLIREYCETFTVIVPFRCQSAGTLVALGADNIIMLPEGQLSPVDPSTNGPYNPRGAPR